MDANELARLLDGLDRRLALGEIDFATYNALKSKFTSQGGTSGDPLAQAVASIGKEAHALRCPGCMATLAPPLDPTATSAVCEYCGGTYALQAAESEMADLRSKLRTWMSEMTGSSGGGSGIDEASRSFIFRDKLYPSLRVAADRATEVFSFSRHQALFSVPIAEGLRNSPLREALQASPDLPSLVDKLKDVVVRLESPELSVFAVGAREKADVAALEVQCQEAIYLGYARRHVASFTSDALQKAQTNLRAVGKLYAEVAKLAGPADAAFAGAMAIRVEAVESAEGELSGLLHGTGAIDAGAVSERLAKHAASCEEAAAKIESSGKEPKDVIPAAEGARMDAQSMRLLGKAVDLFGTCGAATGQSFSQFADELGAIVASAAEPSSDLAWLADFVDKLAIHLLAVSGEARVAVVDSFDWVEPVATSQIRSTLLGGRETASVSGRQLYPFWVADLFFSKQKGVIFKKGQAEEGLMLLDAARQSTTWAKTQSGDAASQAILGALASGKDLAGRGSEALIPVVGADSAAKRMKAILESREELRGATARLRGVVYLPVASVEYRGKHDVRRETLLPSGALPLSLNSVSHVALGERRLMMAR